MKQQPFKSIIRFAFMNGHLSEWSWSRNQCCPHFPVSKPKILAESFRAANCWCYGRKKNGVLRGRVSNWLIEKWQDEIRKTYALGFSDWAPSKLKVHMRFRGIAPYFRIKTGEKITQGPGKGKYSKGFEYFANFSIQLESVFHCLIRSICEID